VAIFKPLKTSWRKVTLEYKQKHHKYITKGTFTPLFKKAMDLCSSSETIKNGFKICEIFPFDENASDYTKCISNRKEEILKTAECPSINDFETTLNVLNFYPESLCKDFLKKKENE
jgi:hypothetical protein